MKITLYFVVFSFVTVGLFVSLLYLMTVVDPGLKELPYKARMEVYYAENDKVSEILVSYCNIICFRCSTTTMEAMGFSEMKTIR